mmetsp:Transcript_46972/g.77977  ORF Transcript_46972/g.77977 Transcript_46972/m.77977 type:complete len:221 (-) Transcript_46972:1243-1905(-)
MATDLIHFQKICSKILGIGRNYAKHARELGNALPSSPVIFMKPTSSLISDGECIRIPHLCTNLHHEVELGVIIGQRAKNVPKEKALEYIGGYCLALDMTARDFQDEAKKKQLPWTLAKGFDTSCVVSSFIDKSLVADVSAIHLQLSVNDEVRQDGSTDCMLFDVPSLIEYTSLYFTLLPGDIILTGTPEGVGQVYKNDVLQSKLWTADGKFSIQITNKIE